MSNGATAYTRILPPASLLGGAELLRYTGYGFARDLALEQFVRTEFLSRDGLFFDAEHGHLGSEPGRVGFLWAAGDNVDKGSVKAGTCQLVRPPQAKWSAQRAHYLLLTLFDGYLPTYLVTLSAPICAEYTDREFFALIDHELSHTAVAKDPWGAPRFSDATGLPVWATRPHDAETFVGTTERWGADATGTRALIAAGLKEPRFAWVPGNDLNVSRACGNP